MLAATLINSLKVVGAGVVLSAAVVTLVVLERREAVRRRQRRRRLPGRGNGSGP
jgi:hypothetical protein